MTTDITLRGTKGAPLTYDEVDANFANLKETADAAYAASAGLGGKAMAAALGTSDTATDMGTTPGTILSDNGTAKQWFQESEAAIEERPTFATLSDPSAASGIGAAGGGSVQSELDAIRTGSAVFNLPDEADGDPIPAPGSGRMYLSGGVLKIA